jgi:hypothetical protein
VQSTNIILEAEHNLKVAENMRKDKTINLVKRNFFWPETKIFTQDYVHSCSECQQNTAAHQAHYGLHQYLTFGYQPGDSLSLDFIIKIPVLDGFSLV